MHDAFSAYFNYQDCSHCLCNAHILRDLKYLHEEEKQKWALPMMSFLRHTLHQVHEKGVFKTKAKIEQEFIKILKKGYKENGFPKEWCGREPDGHKIVYNERTQLYEDKPVFKQRSHSKPMQLLNRLRNYQKEVLAFAFQKGVPFTNNLAERDLRMTKLKEKVSGCFRSRKVAANFLLIRSFLSTLRKREWPLLDNLVLAQVLQL